MPTRLRLCLAVMLAVLAATAIALLFERWHVVRDHAIDGELVAAALYVGPDYRVTSEERADMLGRGLDAGVTERVCRGIDHLGHPTLIATIAVLAIAGISALTVHRRWHFAVAVAAFVATVAMLVLVWNAGFLRHFMEDVGPDAAAAPAFAIVQLLCFATATLTLVAALWRGRAAPVGPTTARKLGTRRVRSLP